MVFPQIQNYFKAQIAANAALASLGGSISFNPTLDPEASASLIASAIRTNGVCIEVGFPRITNPTSALDGTTKADILTPVFVTESLTIAHSPALLWLVNEVVLACTARLDPTLNPARLEAAGSELLEQGVALHSFFFSFPMNIKQSSSVAGKDFNSDFGLDFK